MNEDEQESRVHASAVAVGEFGILIRGRAGSGKSSLALALIDDPKAAGVLVGDDQIRLVRARPESRTMRSPATRD